MFNNNKRIISYMFFLSGLLLVFLANVLYGDLKLNTSYAINEEQGSEVIISGQESKKEKVKINLSFIGDSLLASFKGETYHENFQDLLETHDYKYPFSKVIDIFKKDDFTIANGENVFTDNNLTPILKNHDPAYWYYTRSRFANVYKESSIEVVSIMNNHTTDYGDRGYQDTIQALTKAEVLIGGEKPLVLEKNGLKIGLICTNLFHEFQANNVNKKINDLKKNVDFLIVYFHGGQEYQYQPTENIKKYSRSFVDNGADLVIGCHTHLLGPIEVYKNKTIVYSLGSFLFGGTTSLVNRTIIYQVSLEFDLKTKDYQQDTNIIPCYLYSSKTGYEKWLPSVILDENEKQMVIDFMNNKRKTPL